MGVQGGAYMGKAKGVGVFGVTWGMGVLSSVHVFALMRGEVRQGMGEHGKGVLVREWSRGHGGEGEQEGEVR